MAFDRNEFLAAFDKKLKTLDKAEKVTKEIVKEMSRDLLHITYENQDIGFINRFINALTPMNRKTAILFFKEFSGFTWNKDEVSFITKDKKNWEKTVAKGTEALEDPHFNLWTWAEKNVEVEVKPLDLSKITVFVQNALKKAEAQGISKADVFKAMMAGGLSAEEIVDMLAAMA